MKPHWNTGILVPINKYIHTYVCSIDDGDYAN